MKEFLERASRLTPKQLLLLALDQQESLDALQARAHAPIAIVGMGCRFPGGANDPDAFWRLLDDGRDAIRPVPADRWDADAYFDADPDVPGAISVRTGGFVDEVSGFDAAFFGIAQREARSMDPQQRLLLEVAWEALERAGLPADSLFGKPAGVFVGLCNSDHFARLLARGEESIDAYIASGNAPSVAAGRIAYCLGLQGPALTVDTACSSSLIALHLACRSLRVGESEVALACGVNVMCSPETSIALTKSHMLAPDGRCKTFDAAADGFARGEGCGVLVLARLDDALAKGLPVLAVIRGTATNQDGRSAGLTVPNGPAQEAVIRAALADAGLSPHDIDYVEAHGTGTSLGDPIEVRALAAALGRGRTPGNELRVGSVKTNIGHLESAAGVAGVIKVVLALQHGRLPPHLHFHEPSPHIPWADIPLRVTAEGEDWSQGERPRRAGVSSFGFSGSNAHVILEEAPPARALPPSDRPAIRCLPLSARTPEALSTLARRAADWLARNPDADLGAVARLAGAGRSHHAHRLAVVAGSVAEARDALDAAAAGRDHPQLRRGAGRIGSAPDIVFMFTGQGSQYAGMGRELYETSQAFREVIDLCDAVLGADAAGLRLKQVIWDEGEALHETVWTQPALFAIEVAAARMWQATGIQPAAVIGHSLGEYAAACVAGVFSLEDGLRLVAERGRLTQSIGGGAMAALFTSAEDATATMARCGGRVALAAVNAADNVVVSGEAGAVDRIVADFAARGVEARRLQVSFAAHSPLVEPVLDRLEAAARSVPMQAPTIPVAWNRGGLSSAAPDAGYWRAHLRDTVRFGEGVAALHREGYRVFLEVGPHPTLTALAQRSVEDAAASWLPTMRRSRPDAGEVAASLAELYGLGAAIAWSEVEPQAAPVAWPTYPFEHRDFWEPPQRRVTGAAPRSSSNRDALVGARLGTATPLFETRLTPASPAGLGDHRVQGRVIAPAPFILAMAQACAAESAGPAARRIENVAFRAPLVVPDEGCVVQTHVAPQGRKAIRFDVSSRGTADAWTLHASGDLVPADPTPPEAVNVAALRARLGPAARPDAFLDRLVAMGVLFGPAFSVLGDAAAVGSEALVWIRRPGPAEGVTDARVADAAMLDGACQTLGLAAFQGGMTAGLSVLATIASAWWRGPLPDAVLAHAVLQEGSAARRGRIVGEVTLLGESGDVLGQLTGVTLEPAAAQDADELCYAVEWRPADPVLGAARALRPASVEALTRAFEELAERHGLALYDDLLLALDRLSSAAIAGALKQLGFRDQPGRRFTTDGEAGALGVAARHRRLFGRLLAIMAEDGVLASAAGGWTVAAPLPAAAAPDDFAAALARFGGAQGELQLLSRCAGPLAAVLRGEDDPLHLLFPGGSFREARAIYVESPYARTYNNALVAALRNTMQALPDSAMLRVLEIGGGTGGTTGFVLDALPRERTAYTFTDVSPAFVDRARADFAETPFLDTALLDLEIDPAVQGFRPGGYDVVVAANVLHATTDLARSVQRAYDLLAPGGVLLLLEGVATERWIDLTFGMTQGWWHFTDSALRSDYPLIPQSAWRGLLADAGFADVALLPGEASQARSRRQQALIVARRPSASRSVTIVGPGAAAERLARALAERGDRAVVVAVLPPGGVAGDLVHLRGLALEGLGFDATPAQQDSAERCSLAVLADLQAFASHPDADRAWIVTAGAQAVDAQMAAGGRWQAPLWGLGRVFGLEHPDRWGGLVDLSPGATADDALSCLLAALDTDDGEDQVAWRNGRRRVARLAPASAPALRPAALDADGVYLVTGGFGGLGEQIAPWLAERGARSIVLAGRHPKPASDAIQALQSRGVEIVPRRMDIADEADVVAFLRELSQQGRVLRGVLHAAADLNVAPFSALGDVNVRAMLRPKIAGTALLERLTRGPDRDLFALFSSSTALLGAAGFAHYAAANAFLDATAASAPDASGAITSINWGTWEVMRGTSQAIQDSYRASGLEPLPADEALRLLEQALASGTRQLMVARIDWSRMKPLQEARRPRPFLAEVGIHAAAPAGDSLVPAAAAPSGLAQRLASASPAQREEILLGFVRSAVVATLDDDGPPPGLDIGMFDLGLDSLMSVELKRRLEAGAGCPLPTTLTFNHPTIRAMAAFLDRTLAARTTGVEATAPEIVELAPPPDDALLAADLDTLSDEDLTARLVSRLEEIR